MSRPLRITYPGAWYHVMNRGRRREDIFTDTLDYQLFLDILQETIALHHLRVAAYCLMPNHYHLLLQTPEGNLSRCMRHVNGVYTQRFNRLHDTDGSLFCGRYKAILIDEDNYLLEVLRYIYRNPVRAGLVEKVGAFRYSSHKGYVSRAARWDWLHKEFPLSMFSQKRASAVRAYKSFVEQEEPEEIERFFSLKNLPSILGSREFKDRIRERHPDLRALRETPEAKILAPPPEEIKKTVCKYFKISAPSLMRSRRGRRNIPRDIAIYLVRYHCCETLAETGHHFNMSNYSSTSSAVERVKKLLKKNAETAKQVKELTDLINNKSQKQT